MFKALLWDIDNTLLDFNAAEAYSLKARFKEYALGECSEAAVLRYHETNIRFWEMLEKGKISKSRMLEARFEEFFNGEGIACSNIKAFNEDYENGIADKIFFNENSLDIIKSLKDAYKQYAVTNGAYSVQTLRLKKSGLAELMNGAFISDSVGAEKPSKEFFNYVLNRIEPCKKEEILIIGDSLSSDMKGGNNAGIKTCWYNPENRKNGSGVHIDYEIQSLDEAYEILKR